MKWKLPKWDISFLNEWDISFLNEWDNNSTIKAQGYGKNIGKTSVKQPNNSGKTPKNKEVNKRKAVK